MSLHFSLLLLLTALPGTQSLTTVSGVSVKVGESITIPCLYEPKYKHKVKYLCAGYEWLLCTVVIRASGARNSKERFMINDDPNQNVFTVTIYDVWSSDTYYWCAVDLPDSDIKRSFELVVTTGVPGLHVDNQDVMGFVGEDLTIRFYHSNTGDTEWCRLGGPCVSWPFGEIDGTAVTITFNRNRFFTVTMGTLRTESRGWYYCARGALKMPVHITVEQRPPPKTTTVTILPPTSERANPASATSEVPTTIETGDKRISRYSLNLIIISSSASLVFIVTVSVFILFVLKKCKKTRTSPDTKAEREVTYSEVMYKRNSHREAIRVPAATDAHVTYSELVTKK